MARLCCPLEDDRLPALDQWERQFRQMVHETYLLRGAEVTLNGTVEARDSILVLAGEGRRPPVIVTPLQHGHKIQWDRAAAAPEPLQEAAAYSTLLRSSRDAGVRRVTVTGPLDRVAGPPVVLGGRPSIRSRPGTFTRAG